MDLVIWRHAEAGEMKAGEDDSNRALTARGFKMATRMAAWLDRQLPENTRIYVSPARRCQETVLRLDRKFKTIQDLAPEASPQQILDKVQWPASKATTLIVGHQPMLGQLIAQLLGFEAHECAIRKGSVWWLRSRERDGQRQTLLVAVQSADML